MGITFAPAISNHCPCSTMGQTEARTAKRDHLTLEYMVAKHDPPEVVSRPWTAPKCVCPASASRRRVSQSELGTANTPIAGLSFTAPTDSVIKHSHVVAAATATRRILKVLVGDTWLRCGMMAVRDMFSSVYDQFYVIEVRLREKYWCCLFCLKRRAST